jgi:aryl-alcohol dehydrogenase-like predicted oxidoreductase
MTEYGGAVWKRLEHHVKEGTIKKLGVSVQSPEEARKALAHPNVQHLQLPFNVLDWRSNRVIPRVRKKKRSVTVHARSVFLQGVLTANDPSVWPHVPDVDPPLLINWLNRKATEFGRESVADLCLAYVRGQDWIDGVVVGMETEAQLETNLALNERPPLTAKECAAIARSRPRVPEQLLDPAQWPRA